MLFKADWEKTDTQINLPDDVIMSMANMAFPNEKLNSYQIISGGCANLNIKLQIGKDNAQYILRIYIRDDKAAKIEQKISKLLHGKIIVPQTIFIGKLKGYTFAVFEYINGITLRDLMLKEKNYNLSAIMQKLGGSLAILAKHNFEHPGFFDENLKVAIITGNDSFFNFVIATLENKM